MASFIPDCVVLVKRLPSDPRVPRRRKLLLALLVVYLALLREHWPGPERSLDVIRRLMSMERVAFSGRT